ncbi:sigma-70 family RNA polymerase sigma factor [Nocardia sp. NPDC059240]|uniref:sigma-70 family RNA polymerase sigma factor n=1 Tax=Nocardia sp. NPDC059240 TaxID=3346786 RepID=UPI0036C71DEA
MHSASSDARIDVLAMAAAQGDRRATEQFIRATQTDVWRFIAHRTDAGRADDLTQDTYLRALGSLHRFEGRSTARAWLLSIARRVCVDEIRTAMARPRVSWSADWEEAADRGRAGADAAVLEFAEVKIMLAALTEERREALILTQVLGLSYQEAAEVCGCPTGTIRSRVARAREDLIAAARGDDAADARG